jgi:ATP-dependent DNA helicase RecQ
MGGTPQLMTDDSEKLVCADLTLNCISIDLEVGIRDGQIHEFAAVRGGVEASVVFHKGSLSLALERLDSFCAGADFLLGHNLINFDLVHLAAAKPELSLLRIPAIDTLWLNPLAFPRNPYHHLVKHYQEGQLKRGRINDPELDARLTLTVFRDQAKALRATAQTDPDRLQAWHWLTTQGTSSAGFDEFFKHIRQLPRPNSAQAVASIERCLSGHACQTHAAEILQSSGNSWPLAYALAWISVSGGNSVMPPWVRHQFPRAGEIVKLLRDTPCKASTCTWCSDRHNAKKELARWFTGLTEFRSEPLDASGRPLQQAIVQAAMRGEHVLGILPTGTGKSICYQLPALSRFEKTGALTVVISPLVALMADQVTGLEARGITSCAAINGMLSMPERADVLDRIRLGDVGILIVSPEQLRNRSLRKALEQREIGAWVLDEAHCISKWGHDFRPDYRYVGRFIKEKAADTPVPPILCLTATAKPDVVTDMISYFAEKVGVDIKLFDGGATRTNLEFAVVPTSPAEKLAHIHQILEHDLPADQPGGAIVYCSTRKNTQEVSEFLQKKGLACAHFHAGIAPETKKYILERFIHGDLRVISATNAFGMGIDKPDVRLVIHADIPGSLENYLQEAGRAGRDRALARCVLLYTPEDVERQFGMSARSRLTQRDIQAILKSLRNLDRKKRLGGEVVATSGEILTEEQDGAFDRDSATDDTRVRTAISWLEEAVLLRRDENNVQIFPSSLRVNSLDEAKAKLAKSEMTDDYLRKLLLLVEALIAANADEGISTDELMGSSGLSPEMVRNALYDLEKLGVASNDMALTAFVHLGVERSSNKRLEEAAALEIDLIAALRETAPDLSKGESSFLHLRRMTQYLKDMGHVHALPEIIWRLVRGIAQDGRRDESGTSSLRLRRIDAETVEVHLQREWSALTRTAVIRRAAAKRLLDHLLQSVPVGSRGTDLLAETTLGKLLAAITGDLELKSSVKEPQKLLDRALLWLHEQDVIRLNKGLAVFRPAMTIRLDADRRGFTKADFAPLKLHYDEQVVQIHVMAEYVQRGLQTMADALHLTMDYFSLDRDVFMARWLPDREKEISHQTTPASWRKIVEDLNNPVQKNIVADDREQTNVLVLAGPGSGKTRALVHRIAYLVRVKREKSEGILALAYNRHAAVEIRRRLRDLIGDDAKGVTVLTCHAMAMRLVGASFAGRMESTNDNVFREILLEAIALLKGDGLPPEEADEQRDRLLSGFRWILVDEYQDIGPEQYDLISALAGRTRQDEDGKLSLFAVGDDDQNIYAFSGASVDFIRRFETDYAAKATFLIENYRSSAHIIDAANAVIAPAQARMKTDNPIVIDRARRKDAPGGAWQTMDPVGRGRVQFLTSLGEGDLISQAVVVMHELERLAALDPAWNWSRCAVISREWKILEPIRAYCETNGIPVQTADDEHVNVWRLRETQQLVAWVRTLDAKIIHAGTVKEWLGHRPEGTWWSLLMQAVDEYSLETTNSELPASHFVDWLAEWGREVRRRQAGLLLLTAHRSKGLEFDHVAVLDGGWGRNANVQSLDETRRLFYVAMTRARQTLTLVQMGARHTFSEELRSTASVFQRPQSEPFAIPPELHMRYTLPSMRDVDIGFAGRHATENAIHQRLSALVSGSPLQLLNDGQRWILLDQDRQTVGHMSRAFSPPSEMKCVSAHVMAIQVRRLQDTEEDYQHLVKSDSWEVVLPELVFAPKTLV